MLQKSEHSLKALNASLGLFALLMSFNSLLLGGTNISIFVFGYILLRFGPDYSFFTFGHTSQYIALLFIVGVLTSTFDVNTEVIDAQERALVVLPNYIYWAILIIILSNLKFYINWLIIGKYIFYGLVLTLIIYTLRKSISLPIVKNNTPNSYAFILVCFSAISVTYVSVKYNKVLASVLLGLIMLSLLSIERRAGFVLVSLSSTAAMYLKRVKIQYLTTPLIVVFTVVILLQLDTVENALLEQSPRVHELIYANDEIITTDQSYLTRRLMIERGMVVFSEHPLTGIGLNNYAANKIVNTEGNFEGADLVLAKAEDIQFSAHNSYLLVLVEGGLVVLIPVLLMFAYYIYQFVTKYNQRTPIESAFYWSFIAVCIHLYFIAEIVNVYAWFLFACVGAISTKYRLIKGVITNE